MGKHWDYDVPSIEIWQEVLRVLKPGGYLLSFAGTRTQHRMAVRIEDAGFEIRDMIAWVYGSGFPKSLNIGKAVDKLQGNEREELNERGGAIQKGSTNWQGQDRSDGKGSGFKEKFIDTKGTSEWEGWGTALKPALEPITVARKPLEGTVAENCLKWGVGGINIDGCRVNVDREAEPREYDKEGASGMNCGNSGFGTNLKKSTDFMTTGRFPANLIHDGSDEVVRLFPNSKSSDAVRHNNPHKSGSMAGATNGGESFGFNDSGSAARFFYKATFNYKDICQDPSQISFAQYVESKLTGHGKLTVQEAVEILEAQEDLPYQQELQAIRDCIGSFKNSTQIPKDVGAAKWENTDIILIMLNLLKLSGYARLAIEGNTNSDTKAKAEQKSEHARFLYQAKASKSERNRGCEGLPLGEAPASARSKPAEGRENALGEPRANNHPTVKPIALMEYLVKLVTKPNHIVIDPFTGSGSTLIACKNLGRRYIGIERESEYCKIAETRLAAVKTLPVLF